MRFGGGNRRNHQCDGERASVFALRGRERTRARESANERRGRRRNRESEREQERNSERRENRKGEMRKMRKFGFLNPLLHGPGARAHLVTLVFFFSFFPVADHCIHKYTPSLTLLLGLRVLGFAFYYHPQLFALIYLVVHLFNCSFI